MEDKWFSNLELVDPLAISHKTLKKKFNKLTGLKLTVSFLSGLPLSNGTTVTTFAFSGNTLFPILQLMAFVSIGAKKLDVILMCLGGMISIPNAFLVSISFRSYFTLSLGFCCYQLLSSL